MQRFQYRLLEDGTYAVTGYEGDEGNVKIPETAGGMKITILTDKIFYGHSEIVSVFIPDTVTDLGEFLFDGCLSLKSLMLPKELKNLWGHTFVRTGLEEITIPDGVKKIPPFAFKDCRNLKRVVCGKGMERIYSWAFEGCTALTEIICSEGVDISDKAFESLGQLHIVY